MRVIVQAPRSDDAEAAIRRTGGQVRGALPQVAGMAAELPAGRVLELSREQGVVR